MIQSIIIITIIIIMNVYAKKRKEKIYLPTTYLHIIMTLYHDTYQLIKCSWQNFHKFTSLFVGVSAKYMYSGGWCLWLCAQCQHIDFSSRLLSSKVLAFGYVGSWGWFSLLLLLQATGVAADAAAAPAAGFGEYTNNVIMKDHRISLPSLFS